MKSLVSDLVVGEEPPVREASRFSGAYKPSWTTNPDAYRAPASGYVGGASRYEGKAWKTGHVREAEPPTMLDMYGDYTVRQALNNMPRLAGLDFIVRELCQREYMKTGERGVLRLLDYLQGLTLRDVLP